MGCHKNTNMARMSIEERGRAVGMLESGMSVGQVRCLLLEITSFRYLFCTKKQPDGRYNI